MRINPTEFCESVGQAASILETTPLSANWVIPRFRRKGEPFPWIQQILDLQNGSVTNGLSSKVSCITDFSLEKWNAMSVLDIRKVLPSKPGPLKRFKAAKNRLTKFKDVLERFKQSQILEEDFRSHVLEPIWAPTELCACCKKPLHFSSEPRNLTRRCTKPCDFPVQLLDDWALRFDQFILAVDEVISKLS